MISQYKGDDDDGMMANGNPKSDLPAMGFIAVRCHFTRPPGDPWNEQTWPFPLIRETADGSRESQIITAQEYDDAFLSRFVDAGERLAARDCVEIITSCGFLALAQQKLSEKLPIPIATSSLVQVPSVLAFLPPSASVGILTYNALKLTFKHLEQMGVPEAAEKRIHIVGAPTDGHLQKLVRENGPYYREDLTNEFVRVAKKLVSDVPSIKAIVLECTQMPPFAQAISEALEGKVTVYDAHTMGCWFYSGLVRRSPEYWQ